MNDSAIEAIFHKITQELKDRSSEITSAELNNLSADLEACYNRLQKAEYKIRQFSENSFDIKSRIEEFFFYFESYFVQAKVWQTAFTNLLCDDIDQFNFLDVGSGWSPRIGLALFNLNYTGIYQPLDSNQENTSRLVSFLSKFKTSFKITPIHKNFFRLPALNGKTCIIANHIIDDFLFDYYLDPDSLPYSSEANLKLAWEKITKLQNYQDFIEQLSEKLKSLTTGNDSIILFSHYKSYLEFLLNLDKENQLCETILNAIIEKLKLAGFKTKTFQIEDYIRSENRAKQNFILLEK